MWHRIIETASDPLGMTILLLAGVLALSIVGTVLRKKHSAATAGRFEAELEELARFMGWTQEPGASPRKEIDLENLSFLWLTPPGSADAVLGGEVAPRLQNPRAIQFYQRQILTAGYFKKKKAQQAICARILEMLDTEPAPSVVQGTIVSTDSDANWGDEGYKVLSEITLLEHLLNCAEIAIGILRKRGEGFILPNTLIAVLAHDLGKLPSLQKGGKYHSAEHPIISVRALEQIPGFLDLPSHEAIAEAVRNHHRPHQKGIIAEVLREADSLARKREFVSLAPGYKGKILTDAPEAETPTYVAPSDRPTLRPRRSDLSIPVPGEGSETPPPAEEPPPINQPEEEQSLFGADEDGPAIDDLLDGLMDDPPEPPEESEKTEKEQPQEEDQGDPGIGRGDIKWEWAVHHAKEGRIECRDDLKGLLRIGNQRADAIWTALEEEGLLNFPQQTKHEKDETPPVPPRSEGRHPLDPPEEEPPSRDEGHPADISRWFNPDKFLEELDSRLDRDQQTEPQEGKKRKYFYQGISSRDGIAFFNIPCLREIAAKQMAENARDVTGAKAMTDGKDPVDAEFQNRVLLTIVRYFEKRNLIYPVQRPDGQYAVPCTLYRGQTTTEGTYVPFRLEHFGTWDEMSQRKQQNPKQVGKITNIKIGSKQS